MKNFGKHLLKGLISFALATALVVGGVTSAPAVTARADMPVTTYRNADGEIKTVNAIMLTDNMTELEGGWYIADDDITFLHKITLTGDVNLILANGATMKFGEGENSRLSGIAIDGNGYNLTIYDQGPADIYTGTLKIYNNCSDNAHYGSISVVNANFVMNGGNVIVNHYGGYGAGIGGDNFIMNGGSLVVYSKDKSAVNMNRDITINGGNITATAPTGAGLKSYSTTVTLGYTNATDSITASSYNRGNNGCVKVADGKYLTDGTKLYSGTLSDDQCYTIKGKTLIPACVVDTTGITNGAVTASAEFFAIKDCADGEKTVSLTVTPDERYAVGTVSFNDGSDHTITPVNGEYSFVMPTKDVKVNATFLKSLEHSDITIESISDQGFSGSEITPSITVKDGSTTLTQGVDYTVAYSNNKNAGTATVKVTGMGSYTGTKTATFTINKAPHAGLNSINTDLFVDKTSVEVDIKEHIPSDAGTVSSITAGSEVVTGKADVTGVSLQNGVLTVTASGGAIGDTIKVPVNIEAQNFDSTVNVVIKIVELPTPKLTSSPRSNSLTYNGREQVLLSGGTVENGRLEYIVGDPDGNVSDWSTEPVGKNAGRYTVLYRVKGNEGFGDGEQGSLFVTIGPKPITVKAVDNSKTAGSVDPKLTVEILDEVYGTPVFSYTVSRAEGETVGTYDITVSGEMLQGNGNYKLTYKSGTFTINAASVTNPDTTTTTSETTTEQGGTTTTPETTNNPDSTTTTPETTGNTDGSTTKTETTTNADGSTTKTETTTNADGSTTVKEKVTKKDGSSKSEETTRDAEGNVVKTVEETVKVSKKGTVTVKTTTETAEGTRIENTEKTTSDGKIVSETTETAADGSTTYKKETKKTDGSISVDTVKSEADNAAVITREQVSSEGRKKTDVYSVSEASKGAGKKNSGKVELSSITAKERVETVPDTIKVNGKTYKVDSIGENALAGNKRVRELTLGKYVKTIGENAFANAKKLKDIQIYSNVTEVGAGAFDGIAKNAVITIHADEKTFEAIVKLIKASGVGKKVKFVRAE